MIIGGTEVTGWPSFRIARRGVGLVPEGRQIFPNLTVRENLLAMAANWNGKPHPWTLETTLDLFPTLHTQIEIPGSLLSGGEQQMLAIGRALMTNPQLLILDEATEGLAPLIREEIWRVLARLKSAGQSILIVDKNIKALGRIADSHYVLEKGRIIWSGGSAELRDHPELQRRYLGMCETRKWISNCRKISGCSRTRCVSSSSANLFRSKCRPWMDRISSRTCARRSNAKRKSWGFGYRVPEEYGGMGLGHLGMVVVWEELARTVALPPRGPGVFGPDVRPVLFMLSPEQKEKYLLPVLSGDKKTAFAQTEPDAGADPGMIRTTASAEVTITSSMAANVSFRTSRVLISCRSWLRPIEARERAADCPCFWLMPTLRLRDHAKDDEDDG